MRDINKVLPKFPGMKWGALFNWKLENAEIDEMVRRPIFPSDSKWHLVQRDNYNSENKDIIVDGYIVKRSDDKKLT